MDKRSGFWQVDLTAAAQELLAFITPKGGVFKWKVMPFGVANAPALFQELMNKILYILRRRPLVQELISRGAEMEAHIDDVSLGTNTQEDHVHDVRSFVGACNFYRRHIHNFTYSSAPLTDLIKKTTPWGGPPETKSVSRSCKRKLPPPTAWEYPALRAR